MTNPSYPEHASTLRPEVARERLHAKITWLGDEATRLDPTRSTAMRAGGGLLVITFALACIPLAGAWFIQAFAVYTGPAVLPGLAWTTALLTAGLVINRRAADAHRFSSTDWFAACVAIALVLASVILVLIAGTDIVDVPPGSSAAMAHGAFTALMAIALLVAPGDALTEANRMRAHRLRSQARALQIDLQVLNAIVDPRRTHLRVIGEQDHPTQSMQSQDDGRR